MLDNNFENSEQKYQQSQKDHPLQYSTIYLHNQANFAHQLRDRQQFVIIAVITFFLSAAIDNLTTTIVMIQISRRFFKGRNFLITTAAIVVLANAGGAWSPLGDVTTIMIWLADKFTVSEIVLQGIIPSVVLGLVSGAMFLTKLEDNAFELEEEKFIRLSRGEKLVIATGLGSFSLPLVMNMLGLPPYLGLVMGLGITWMLIEYAKVRSLRVTHLEANIEGLLQKADIASLKFFIGILLSVSALKSLGVLEKLSVAILGAEQEFTRVAVGNIALGLISAIVDNVPLTAIAIDIISLTDPQIWVLLALTIGTGGSFLVIGSVAGIVAMGMNKQLTFGTYIKVASIPALVGYFAAVATWIVQYQVLN